MPGPDRGTLLKEIMEYNLVRSKRRSVSLHIRPDGSLEVRAPLFMRGSEIERIVREKEGWILKQQAKIARQEKESEESGGVMSREEVRNLAEQALKVIPERVKYYAPLVGVNYGRITIRSQRTRWGSCTRQGNLNFNCLLMLAPPEVLDSVVVHELCHRKEMNHSDRFYREVLRVYPEYHKWNKWLKEHGGSLLRRLP